MWARFTSHLYLRIWLAVVGTVMVLIFMVGAAWRLSRDPPQLPIREVLVHNLAGEVIGKAQTKPDRMPGDDLEFDVTTNDGQTFNLLLPRPKRPLGPNPWDKPNFGLGFGWMLIVVGAAVALGAYPIMRRLTLRLEALQRGVERWGAGDLSARVKTEGRDEVAFLAERFNHAAERIETLMDSHKSLLANASHELRSPLARIRMGLELMGSGTTPTVRDEISRNIAELDQLIDEILLSSRLDARESDMGTIEQVDLTGLAAEECARSGAELVEVNQGRAIVADGVARLLRRAFRNLLENARRYGDGLVTVEVKREGSQAVVRVSDQGPGVPPAERERIFEPFYRLQGVSERDGGVGLGLALVRSIATRHNGSVRCEGNSNGGATFVFNLPCREM